MCLDRDRRRLRVVHGLSGLQYSALRQLRGAWLVLSTVPLVGMAIVLVYTAIGLFQGSNLWPLLLILTAPLATVYLLVLRLAMRFLVRPR